MTTHDALLANILATPADDLPRLVYADWLEENGEPERAEFIRVQCELEKCQWQGDLIEPRGRYLVHKEIKLLEVNGSDKWFAGPPWLELVTDTQVKDGYRFPDGARSGVIRRGFVSEVRCRLADWCGGECGACDGSGADANTYRGTPEEDPCRECSGTGRTA